MKKMLLGIVSLAVLSGCAGPQYTGSAISKQDFTEIVIVNDAKTRKGFRDTMESWLNEHDYKFEVVAEDSEHDSTQLTLEFLGRWSWDLAMYISEAYIEAFNEGQQVGKVEYRAPNTLNTNKFGNAEERIGYMMDILFGELSVSEANRKLRSSEDKANQ